MSEELYIENIDLESFDNVLVQRFGTPIYEEDSLLGLDESKHPRDYFHELKRMQNCTDDTYESGRQLFLKLLGQHRMAWKTTNKLLDYNVEVSRIYRENEDEFIAFMRIRPKGFRGERLTSNSMEMVFHLLMGKASFYCRKKCRILSRGQQVAVPPKSVYAIKCLGNEPAYFAFHLNSKPKLFRLNC